MLSVFYERSLNSWKIELFNFFEQLTKFTKFVICFNIWFTKKKIISEDIWQFELRFAAKNKETKNQIWKIKKFLTSKFLILNEFSWEMDNRKLFRSENYMTVFIDFSKNFIENQKLWCQKFLDFSDLVFCFFIFSSEPHFKLWYILWYDCSSWRKNFLLCESNIEHITNFVNFINFSKKIKKFNFPRVQWTFIKNWQHIQI